MAGVTDLVLPLPISVNHYYQRRRGGGVMISREGRVYKDVVYAAFRMAGGSKIIGPVGLRGLFVFPDKKVRDLDNFEKSLMDSLKDVAFEDDKFVREKHFYGGGVQAEGCLYLRIFPSSQVFSTIEVFGLTEPFSIAS